MFETEKLVDSYRRAIVINGQRGLLGRLQLSLARRAARTPGRVSPG